MALTVGIIGLPQSGKTTLFNALTRAGAQISGYPTSTVQANRAVVEVPDERLARLAEIFHPRKVVPTTVEFVDVAGLGQAAEESRKQGLSAEFLGHIRNADALAIVVRCFSNPASPHPAGSIDATRDLDHLMTELALTDLASVEKRIESNQRKAKSGDKKPLEENGFLERL
ncbi:MAG TPA: GTPase, partial [Ktedonobacterales bacterium]|nr:GTPase [Ktedonobacterales bacterium]